MKFSGVFTSMTKTAESNFLSTLLPGAAGGIVGATLGSRAAFASMPKKWSDDANAAAEYTRSLLRNPKNPDYPDNDYRHDIISPEEFRDKRIQDALNAEKKIENKQLLRLLLGAVLGGTGGAALGYGLSSLIKKKQ